MENREGQNYRVVDGFSLERLGINAGDECVMVGDYESDCPIFYNENWVSDGKWYLSMSKVELIEERPERYASRVVNGMDVIDLINHWNLNFQKGNILKYLLREKGEDESDLEKIIA